MNCVFCQIVQKKIPSYIIYEDDYTLVFLDIAQDVDGHMLAIPKKHVQTIFDCDAETLSHLMNTVQKVSHHCKKCGYDGINLLNASDESAGQSVPHFHIHIIPRKKNDQIDAWPHFPGSKTELTTLHQTLKMEEFL